MDYNLALSLDLYPDISWGPDENFIRNIRAAFGGLERGQIRLGKNQRRGQFSLLCKTTEEQKEERERRVKFGQGRS